MRPLLPALFIPLLLAGCASLSSPQAAPPVQTPSVALADWPTALPRLLPTDVLLLGEQHDAPEHQQLQRQTVQWLAERGQLAALVMEMAEQGHSTAGLARDASEAQAQAALQWKDQAWPWASYGPVVMAAVRAGVPVLGGNLPRAQMRATMGQPQWDGHLSAPGLQRQIEALRTGHCGLLPETQLMPMARIQLARDASMAQIAQAAVQNGRTVVLVAGNGHVLRPIGIPTHWPANFRSKVVNVQVESSLSAMDFDANLRVVTPALPPRDACAGLRATHAPGAAAPAAEKTGKSN